MRAEIKHLWIMSQNHTEGLFKEISLLVRNRTVAIIDQFSISLLFSPCYQHVQSKLDLDSSKTQGRSILRTDSPGCLTEGSFSKDVTIFPANSLTAQGLP